MTESGMTSRLSADDFAEMLEFLDSDFRKYMHARERLSELSPSTVRRYSRHLPRRPRLTKEEREVQHRIMAALHVYEVNAISASRGGGHFASGLFATAACEAIMITRLIEDKKKVKCMKSFQRFWKKFRNDPRRSERDKTFAQFLLHQRAEVLFKLCKDAGYVDEKHLPPPVAKVLKMRGFQGRLLDFVRQSRNWVHPRWLLEANERFARVGEQSYSVEAMESLHADFALCAWELHGRIATFKTEAQL